MFVGGFLLAAAAIGWSTGILMSPHGESVAGGTEHVRTTVVIFARNIAFATIMLSALSAVLLFPRRRPPMPRRDWALGILIAMMVGTSLYQLLWLRTSVVN